MVSFTFETQRHVYWAAATWCFVLLAALCCCSGVLHQKTVQLADPLRSAPEPSTMPNTTEQPETMVVDLGSLLDAGDGAVVTLVAGDTRLAAHRAVLSAGSPVLAAMFRPDTLEASSSGVIIPDVEGPVLRQLVAFLYTGRAPQLPSMAPQLLTVAAKYGVSALLDASEQQVLEHLDVESAAATAVISVRNSRHSLRKAALSFIKAHVFEVLATQGWAEAVINNPHEVVLITSLLTEPPAKTSVTTAAATVSTLTTIASSAAAHASTSAGPTTADTTPTTSDDSTVATDAPNTTADRWSTPTAATTNDTTATAATAMAQPRRDLSWTAAKAQLPTPGCHTLLPDVATVCHFWSLSVEERGRRLIHAAEQGALPEMRALIAAGADLEARDTSYGQTALHWAEERKHVEVVRCLLQAGADVNAKRRDGLWEQTALHYAAANGRIAMVRVLLAASADLGAKNKDGQTPLHLAAEYGQAEAVAVLLEVGADREARDDNGRTALDTAKLKNHQQVVQLLQ